MQLPHVSAGFLISLGIATAFEILLPLALALYVSRRLHVRWRYFWYGVAVFAAVQLFTRVPLVYVLNNVLASQLKSSQTFLWTWLLMLALTAGLFEEVGRYFGYRIFMGKEEKTWPKGVMYGIGHGGLESIVLVGLLSWAFSLLNILVIQSLDITKLPATQQATLHDQFATLAAQPAWLRCLVATSGSALSLSTSPCPSWYSRRSVVVKFAGCGTPSGCTSSSTLERWRLPPACRSSRPV